jgi:hypothetical protein
MADAFRAETDLERREALSPFLFNFDFEDAIRKVEENNQTEFGTKWDTSASVLC